MKKILLITLLFPLIGLAQTKTTVKKKKTKAKTSTVISKVTNTVSTATNAITASDKTSIDISAGLREALNKGITEQVSKLSIMDGFYKNEAVKILMPEELVLVENTLRKIGMSHMAEEGIKSLNRAAEDATKEATPIFVEAIKNMSIKDAKNILMGNENAGTSYLQTATSETLSLKLKPIIKQSMGKVGADMIWSSIILKYNKIPLMEKVNPEIDSYVTEQTLKGIFKMIAVEEKKIRTDMNSRTSELLQKVFAIQDTK